MKNADKKYKVSYDWKGERNSCKYKVELKEGLNYTSKTVVRDKSDDLYPEFRNMVRCKLVNNGDGMVVKLENSEVFLDYGDAQYLLTALLAEATSSGYEVRIKEKKIAD